MQNENSDSTRHDFLAPACGLFCGICSDYILKECHGCGCSCGECAGQWHLDHCLINQCAENRSLESCADCSDLPCTKLIQFTHDPIWTTHSVCIDNLRRRKQIGKEKWVEEQLEYFSDEAHRKKELKHHDECKIKSLQWDKNNKTGS